MFRYLVKLTKLETSWGRGDTVTYDPYYTVFTSYNKTLNQSYISGPQHMMAICSRKIMIDLGCLEKDDKFLWGLKNK